MKTNTGNKYTIAILCGVVPLITGTAIFLLWLYSRDISLMEAGLRTIETGKGIVVAGLLSVAAYAVIVYCCGVRPAAIARKAIKPLAIMALNFIVAPTLVMAGIIIATGYVITVENRSKLPLENFHLLVPGDIIQFGTLQPSERKTEQFRIKGDGTIEYRYKQEGKSHSGLVEGYVTNMQGGSISIVIRENGRIGIFGRTHKDRKESMQENTPSQHDDEWALPCMIPG